MAVRLIPTESVCDLSGEKVTWKEMIRGGAGLSLFLVNLTIPGIVHALQQGYIDHQHFDVTAVLTPAPLEGPDRYELDRRIFHQTRNLENTPRRKLAINDVQTDTAHLMADFSCAVGVSLSPDKAPRLTLLLERASANTDAETSVAKRHFKRLRPFQIDQGPICEPASDVEKTYDYPSGHTTLGWTWATILAELLPERARQILARGRAYGDSRIVCRVHNASAVDAGRISASATLTVIRASAADRQDFEAARLELRGLLASAPRPHSAGCRAEQRLTSQDIFAPPGEHAP